MNKISQLQSQKGAALLLFLLFFLFGSTALAATLASSLYSDLVTYRLLSTAAANFYAVEAGVEDVAYRLITSRTVDTEEVLIFGEAVATTTTTFISAEQRFDIVAAGEQAKTHRKSTLSLYMGSGASFNFGVQSGNGGFELTNGSAVQGNVFSNGEIEKTGGGTAWIYGDAISAGATGQIENARVSGVARAHTLDSAYIQGDAYYVTDSASTVLGTRYTGATDETSAELPISDVEIDEIKQDVIDNGTVITAADPLCSTTGTYTVSSDTTLGFVKIECDFTVSGNNTDLTLTGPLWIAGNLTFKSGPNIIVDPLIGERTIPIVVDNPTDRIVSSKISIENSTSFAGSGSPKSYILLISQNNAAENSVVGTAIDVQQSSYGDLLVYAGHGEILLGNSASLKEVTGHKIKLGNNALITYESGLVNLLFTSGPGGGFTFNDWRETY
ncbi:MAG: hypothetical protein AUK16_01945 [Parcubacteria group bacterium CG2_30_44_11]|nr:MAG: hypothetical protein AUK16_01945 [Parcubacteria group bacterium CG2_30_44_11]